MPLNLASPGILVKEIDLTLGRIDPTSDKLGGIVGPFAKGPVGTPTLVTTENDLLNTFGQPYETDKQYETWLTASSYLAYGGILNVVRADDYNSTSGVGIKNAFVGTASSVRIKSAEHYEELGYDQNPVTGVTVAARNPGTWANGLRIGIIDGRADQTIGIATTGATTFNDTVSNATGTLVGSASTISFDSTSSITVGLEVKCDVAGVVAAGTTVLAVPGGGAAGIVTISTSSASSVDLTTTFDFGTTERVTADLAVGYGITQAVPAGTIVSKTGVGAGTTEELDGYFKGIITEIGTEEIGVKFLSHVNAFSTETAQSYNSIYQFSTDSTVAIHSTGQTTSYGSTAVTSVVDWFDQQTLDLTTATVGGATTTTTVKWNTLSERPTTSEYAAARGSRFDELHVVVIDGKGTISGNAGTILEKHLNLSKAKDAEFSVGSPQWWRKYIETNSTNIFAGGEPGGVVTSGYSSGFTLAADTGWDQDAEGIIFSSIGNLNTVLEEGKDYGGISTITSTGALNSGLDDLVTGYGLFENDTNVDVDFLLMGSAKEGQNEARALATKLISVAELRKDAVAFISPYRASMITDNPNQETVDVVLSDSKITDNVINFFEPITSSSYAVFDSGYKYMFDRFANTFRYVPLNGDIAGLCARTDINAFPWFSPAGTARGAILNAVKLAYNPSKDQRDRLYSARVNPVIFSPGAGIVLFGDKTAFAKASAFDRINVRRLFLFLEDAISAAAKDQLFEFNDEITRTNFVNIVEPFLRDVQAKRGITDYVVICDETNNTAAIIDANEFVADIYIKPARSINFIGLNFIATRTGVAFEEVIGNV
tara:strand:- start:1427 stop:3904 length:2478 start_codon:yes stop_codon:yes gene_type:complete